MTARISMDVFFIEAVVSELAPLVTGASVRKVHQPDADTVILRLWNGRRELRLRIDLAVEATGLYLTERPWINPVTPLRFCQLLRARLGFLRTIRQWPAERVVVLTFEGTGGNLQLVAELYGRRPNLVLCDNDWRIVDVLHRREGDAEHPACRPGAIWMPPEARSGFPLEQAAERLGGTAAMERPAEWLRRHVSPMSPLVARELACRIDRGEAPGEVLREFAQQRQQRDYDFLIGEVEGSPRLFAFRPKGLAPAAVREFSTASAAADALFAGYAPAGRGGERTRLLQAARRALFRVEKRLRHLRDDQAASGNGEDLQRLGELLTANLHRVRKGMREIEVEDYYQPGTRVIIPLDPASPPARNAERLFARSRKIRRGRIHVERRLEESGAEKQWLEGLLLDIGVAESGEDLAGVAEEMRTYGLLPRNDAKPARRPAPGRTGLREAFSPGGFPLQWGTNNRANDYLVKHVCRPDDLWFHALGRPGCHLVLKNPARIEEIPEADVLFAASLAAGYSRAASEGRSEVMVARGRHVHKPKGALPGLVQVDSYRTVRVPPRREP